MSDDKVRLIHALNDFETLRARMRNRLIECNQLLVDAQAGLRKGNIEFASERIEATLSDIFKELQHLESLK